MPIAGQLQELARFPCASWAIWSSTFDQDNCVEVKPRAIFDFMLQNVVLLRADVVFLGLNPANHMPSIPFENFHTVGHRGDHTLKCYIQEGNLTNLRGGYMTDINQREVTPTGRVKVTPEDIEVLKKQLSMLGQSHFTVICFGNRPFEALARRVGGIPQEISSLPHSIRTFRSRSLSPTLEVFRVWHYADVGFNHKKVKELKAQLAYINTVIGGDKSGDPRPIGFIQQLDGAEAIYKEPGGYSRVRVHHIRIDEGGLSAEIELVPSPGFLNDRPAKWEIGASTYSNDIWTAPIIGLVVYFGDDLVKSLSQFCSTLSADYTRENHQGIGAFVGEYRGHRVGRELTEAFNRLVEEVRTVLRTDPNIRYVRVPGDLLGGLDEVGVSTHQLYLLIKKKIGAGSLHPDYPMRKELIERILGEGTVHEVRCDGKGYFCAHIEQWTRALGFAPELGDA